MTREDIIRMAHDAGMTSISLVSTADVICSRESLERFAKLVAEYEREECAKLLLDLDLSDYYKVAALLIRERGAP